MVFPQELVFTTHARYAMTERSIQEEWVLRLVSEPELRIRDPNDVEVERLFGRIPERGGRVLRVAVNTQATPWRIVSVFFDRRMRGRL